MFAAMREPRTDPKGYGNVFGNPAGGFMCLICFANGSLAREEVRARVGLSWPEFERAILERTKPGNDGNWMLPYFVPEMTPKVLEPRVELEGSPEFCAFQDACGVRARGRRGASRVDAATLGLDRRAAAASCASPVVPRKIAAFCRCSRTSFKRRFARSRSAIRPRWAARCGRPKPSRGCPGPSCTRASCRRMRARAFEAAPEASGAYGALRATLARRLSSLERAVRQRRGYCPTIAVLFGARFSPASGFALLSQCRGDLGLVERSWADPR